MASSLETTRSALAIPEDHWRSRWLYREAMTGRLHRVAEALWDDPAEMIVADAVMVCGERGRFRMPGMLSRMEGARCPVCCRALGIPRGKGAPFNSEKAWRNA